MPQIIQRSFTSGEVSPSLQSRADLAKYTTGLNLCENFFIRAQGGVYSRPGFSFRGELDNPLKVGRLIPFSFNTEQTYVLVFEHLKMRVMKDGGYVIDGAGPALFELITPYTEDQLPRLNFTQSADVMTIVHPDHDPKDLSRLADDNWNLSDIVYSSTVSAPPIVDPVYYSVSSISNSNPALVVASHASWLSELKTGQIITITGAVGMTELNGRNFTIEIVTGFENTTSFYLVDEDSTGYGAYTSAGIVGRPSSIDNVGAGFGDFDKDYSYVVTTVSVDGVESLVSDGLTITSKSLTQTGGVRLQWEPVHNAAYYRIYKDPSNNTEMFGWIGDSNAVTFEDYNIAPITSDAPPQDRQPFSGTGNKPSIVEYYDQRQIFANTNNEPQVVYTTQVGNYNSLRTSNPVRDDDAVTFTINAKQVNEIRHIVSLDVMILLTAGGEWKVNEGQDKVLTPSSAGVKIQSYNGSSWVKPAVVNSTVLYLQEKGARVRDLGYDFGSDSHVGNDLSLMSEHLFEDHRVIEMAYSDEPYGILWCIRDDGVLLGLTYLREHQVWGWHHHTTDGEFESITTISEGGRDAVYVIVKRNIDGQTKRYVERLEIRQHKNAEDAFYVDSGLSYDGAPATVFSGLNHLEGKKVSILADGNVVEGKTVVGGSITLDRDASKVHIGLPYTPIIETLDIDVASPAETLKAQSVSVSKVIIEVEDTRGGFVGAKQDENSGLSTVFQEIKPRFDLDDYGVVSLKTYKQEVIIDPTWSRGGGIRIEQRSPLPMAILSIIPRVDIGGS